MRYIGIDVSKSTFMVAYPQEKGYKTKEFKNTPQGVRSFITSISTEDRCVMEATGNYSYLLLYLIHEAGISVSMENPLKVKNFARTMLSVTKTDKADAQLLSLYGERMQPEPFKVQDRSLILLRQKRAAIRQFKKQLAANNNLKKSLEVLPNKDYATLKAIDRISMTLEKQTKALEEELFTLTQEEFNQQMKRLTSVKGIGVSLAAALILATGGFTYFSNAKQVSRYLGICPTYQQSGTSINVKGHINRSGDPYLRSQLYVAAWPTSQYNKECHDLYVRLKDKGKSGKLIMIAVANKLIRQAFAVVKKDVDYVDGFISTKP